MSDWPAEEARRLHADIHAHTPEGCWLTVALESSLREAGRRGRAEGLREAAAATEVEYKRWRKGIVHDFGRRLASLFVSRAEGALAEEPRKEGE